jgi:hypothetical protein
MLCQSAASRDLLPDAVRIRFLHRVLSERLAEWQHAAMLSGSHAHVCTCTESFAFENILSSLHEQDKKLRPF